MIFFPFWSHGRGASLSRFGLFVVFVRVRAMVAFVFEFESVSVVEFAPVLIFALASYFRACLSFSLSL